MGWHGGGRPALGRSRWMTTAPRRRSAEPLLGVDGLARGRRTGAGAVLLGVYAAGSPLARRLAWLNRADSCRSLSPAKTSKEPGTQPAPPPIWAGPTAITAQQFGTLPLPW